MGEGEASGERWREWVGKGSSAYITQRHHSNKIDKLIIVKGKGPHTYHIIQLIQIIHLPQLSPQRLWGDVIPIAIPAVPLVSPTTRILIFTNILILILVIIVAVVVVGGAPRAAIGGRGGVAEEGVDLALEGDDEEVAVEADCMTPNRQSESRNGRMLRRGRGCV